MFNSKKINEYCPVYETPQISPMEIGVDSIICASDGVTLNDLEEVQETW